MATQPTRPTSLRPIRQPTNNLVTRLNSALSDLDLGRWSAELLDPDSWGEILSQYGRTMKLAVALTDIHGNLLGPCHNPQPVWSLARTGNASCHCDSGPACPFCLTPEFSL